MINAEKIDMDKSEMLGFFSKWFEILTIEEGRRIFDTKKLYVLHRDGTYNTNYISFSDIEEEIKNGSILGKEK